MSPSQRVERFGEEGRWVLLDGVGFTLDGGAGFAIGCHFLDEGPDLLFEFAQGGDLLVVNGGDEDQTCEARCAHCQSTTSGEW